MQRKWRPQAKDKCRECTGGAWLQEAVWEMHRIGFGPLLWSRSRKASPTKSDSGPVKPRTWCQSTGFHQVVTSHQNCDRRMRLRPTTFHLLFSHSMHAWLGLAYQSIVSPLSHEGMAFLVFCGHLLRISRELPRDQIR